MTARRRITVVFSLLLVVSMAGSVLVVRRLDELRMGAPLEEALYIRSPRLIAALALGYRGLAANLYWTRVVQYFGRKHVVRAMNYDQLQPLLEITTDLDPHLLPAYKFGSIFLAQQPPEGAGQPEAAVELVKKGIRHNPEHWRLYYHLGFIHFIEREDYIAAAEAFEQGAQAPGAHPWMKVMAAVMRQYSGDIQTARFLWTKIYENSEDRMIRANALRRLQALEVDEVVPILEQRVRIYHGRTGEWPRSWEEVLSAGLVRRVPVDPAGYVYLIGDDGQVYVQKPEELPFIREGLPPGQAPAGIMVPGKKP